MSESEQVVTLKELPSMRSLLLGIGKTLVKKGKGTRLPEQTFAYRGQRIDAQHLAQYRKVCGFGDADSLPLTYLHVLAFRLQLAMLLNDNCDFPLLGLVHIQNEITRHKALPPAAHYDFACSFEPVAGHRRGKLIATSLTASIDGELVWEDRSVNLCRMQNKAFDKDSPAALELLPAGRKPCSSTAEPWQLGADLGRRYAKVSGDRNPIHLYRLTAKMLGFKRQIVHGMWTKARVCAEVEPTMGDALRVKCDFKQPVFLPGKVHFYRASDKSAECAEVWDPQGRRAHLVARFE
ncbi:MAG: MaoC/PaaZ C-terminal domain-containing protein [Pseudomonadales bacterium]